MSNLTLSEKSAFDKLPASLRDFTVARVETPFKELNKYQQTAGALEVISGAYIDLNTKFKNAEEESDVKTFQTQFLIKELSGQYGSLTLSEIKRAFYMGVRNEFNTEKEQWYSMCPATYHFFLKKYYNLPQRAEGMKQYLELVKGENKIELSPEEKKAKDKKALIWYFGEYKKNGKLGSGSYAMYQSLWDFGFLKFSAEERKEIREKVESEYTKVLELSRKKQRISANQLAELLLTFDTNPTLKGNLRKEALKRYFDTLIKEGIELETIIE